VKRVFDALHPAIRRMAGYEHPWAVAGGWAIDLFVGRQTRAHADVDLATLRRDQAALRAHLGDVDVRKARDHALHGWLPGETLVLPVHEVHVRWPDGSALELLLNESEGPPDADGCPETWIFRRDARVRRPFRDAFLSREGVPYLAPEIALLFKSNDGSAKTTGDLDVALPTMSLEQRGWLHDAIALGSPVHPWLAALKGN
jgi:hypothetical protein